MTFRIKMLAAASLLALPAVASAQSTGNVTGGVNLDTQAQPAPATNPIQPPPNPVESIVSDTQATVSQPVEAVEPLADPNAATTVEAGVDANPAAEPPITPEAGADAAVATSTDTSATTSTATDATAVASDQAATSAQAGAPAQTGAVAVATAADLRTGTTVLDPQGGAVGTIESADATGAVVATGAVRARLPLASFGKNAQGLVISLTRAQLEAAAQSQTAAQAPTPGTPEQAVGGPLEESTPADAANQPTPDTTATESDPTAPEPQ
ncbi:MAG: hypothetical protein ACXWU1_09315 [Allosphingosinicella sp.]